MTDYDDLCKRLRDAEESQPNVGFGQTADALVALRKQLREAESELALADKALAKAEADNAALRQDAERYRWLRRRNDEVAGGVAANIRVKYRCVESELDAAIDAALLAGKKP